MDWHSGRIQAIDLSNPANPTQAGFFLPKPLNKVALEDPALSEGPNKVVFWSYPIIRNGRAAPRSGLRRCTAHRVPSPGAVPAVGAA